jgi:drug/metabolite transporter (DMT)-like permease
MSPDTYLDSAAQPTPKAPSRRVALALMLIAPALWSIAGVLTRQIERAPALELVFWRSLFAGATVVVAICALNGRGALRALTATGRAGLLSGLLWATMFTCFMVALTLTTTARTLVVSSLAPVLTALLAWAWLREPVSRRSWAAIAVAAVGMAIMFQEGLNADRASLLGTLVALGVPLAAAVNVTTLRRVAASVDLLPAVLIGALISAALALPFAWPFAATARDIGVLALLGVFQLGLPCMLMVVASRTLRASEIGLLALVEVLLGPLWAWLGAGETASGATLLGGALVLVALIANELGPQRAQRPVAASS